MIWADLGLNYPKKFDLNASFLFFYNFNAPKKAFCFSHFNYPPAPAHKRNVRAQLGAPIFTLHQGHYSYR
jgi:hypothetical protein